MSNVVKNAGKRKAGGGRSKRSLPPFQSQVLEWKGKTHGAGFRFGIIVSRFNQSITDPLLKGALRVLGEQGVGPEDIEVVKVPGAFEIPGAAKKLGLLGRFHALICLGAVIQGETPHFHYISTEVSRGIGQLSLELGLPVIFGVLTTDSMEQAIARSGNEINKGAEAALAAIETAHLYRTLK
ncbi:6,7-dimethyl-8-ribityllumazine synthase [Candidatus Manganitrophus noduliformans]|uniref:6,7-dimethyl-8-ribityllumazine synthase n=1 Tax=Candidatus Manganitrophus noduliformans TaxID=2606439 RepID=A0A7X6DRZ5_9BACT|nr:6,7-dimethyl-8-ribityllumazine synthase [Candidatus Manganitrophus noduliformans]NKE72297.1 6,7-dimethyl-8-ribityllumazine synthase [Candidatus Manganitrophus noduliformans]